MTEVQRHVYCLGGPKHGQMSKDFGPVMYCPEPIPVSILKPDECPSSIDIVRTHRYIKEHDSNGVPHYVFDS